MSFNPEKGCEYCKSLTHRSQFCPENTPCVFCKGDHNIISCTKVTCRRCKTKGHHQNVCPNPPNQPAPSGVGWSLPSEPSRKRKLLRPPTIRVSDPSEDLNKSASSDIRRDPSFDTSKKRKLLKPPTIRVSDPSEDQNKSASLNIDRDPSKKPKLPKRHKS